MKKLLMALGCLAILSGCTVSAEEELPSCSAVVVESDDESAVIRIEDEITESETGAYEPGSEVKIEESRDLIIFDGEQPVSVADLEKDDRLMITSAGGKTVMHKMESDESAKTADHGE